MYMYVCIQAEIEAFLDKVCDLFPVGKSEVSLCTLGAMRTSPSAQMYRAVVVSENSSVWNM